MGAFAINKTKKVILDLWDNHIKKSVITQIDAKTRLQEYSLKEFKVLPVYKLIESKGPNHKPTFKIQVKSWCIMVRKIESKH